MKRTLYVAGSSLLALLVLFFAVDPNKVPAFILIIPFVLLFTILLTGLMYALEIKGMGEAKSLRMAILGASLPILLLVLQSIGQLTIRDVLTVLLLFLLAYFY